MRPERRTPLRLIPHLLTLSRLPLGLLFLLVFPPIPPTGTAAAVLILALAGTTDYLDGYLARRLKTVGAFGKWADPLTDAIFFLCVFLSFFLAGLMPLPLLVLFALREVAQHAVIRPLSARLGVDRAARPAGKLKTGLQFAGTLLVIALSGVSAYGSLDQVALTRACTAILTVLVSVSVVSLYWYVRPLVGVRP